MTQIEGDFDYIVVGAGTAGCIVANRLSADPKNRVLILEAGGNDDWIWFHIPVGYLFAIGNPRSDWMFKTEPEAGLNGRSLNYPRGKVIGGSSSINAMIYMRGQATDYDHWRQLGLAGWGSDDVLPFFRRHEDHFLGPSEAHAALVGGARLSQAGARPRQSAARNPVPGGKDRVRRHPRGGRALAAEWREPVRASRRRGDPRGRFDRLGPDSQALRGRRRGRVAAPRHSGRARQGRRRQQPAGSPPASAHLQGRGRQ